MRNSLTAHACLLCFIRSCGVGLITICRRLDLYQACDCGGQKKILGKNKHLPESPEAALFHRQCLPRPCFSFYQRRFRRANCQANNLVSFEYLKWEVLLLGAALALNISICYPLKQPMLVHSGKEMYCQAQMKNNGSRSQLPLGCYVPCYYVCS